MRKLPAKLASQLYGAAELIAERGLDGTKIEDIAEATGIPKATIYYHLDGKNAVLEFLLSDLLDMVAGAVGVAVSSAEDARTRLEAAVVAQLGVMLEHPFLCRALVGDLGGPVAFEAAGLDAFVETDQTRNAFVNGTPADFMSEVFDMSIGDIAVLSGEDTVVIVRLDAITPASEGDANAALLSKWGAQMDQALAQGLFDIYSNAVMRDADPQIDQRAVSAVHVNFP